MSFASSCAFWRTHLDLDYCDIAKLWNVKLCLTPPKPPTSRPSLHLLFPLLLHPFVFPFNLVSPHHFLLRPSPSPLSSQSSVPPSLRSFPISPTRLPLSTSHHFIPPFIFLSYQSFLTRPPFPFPPRRTR